MNYINWFSNVEPALHTWYKSYLIIVYSSFYTLLILYSVGFDLLMFCWGFLHLQSWDLLVCSFLIISLSGFGIRVMLSSPNEWGGNSLCASIFWKRLERTSIIFFLKCLVEFFSFRYYLFIFREGKGGRKRGRECQCVVASPVSPTGDLAHNPGMCPDWELNRWPFGLQASTQSTDPHQAGQIFGRIHSWTHLGLVLSFLKDY